MNNAKQNKQEFASMDDTMLYLKWIIHLAIWVSLKENFTS